MTYSEERDNFIAAMTREGVPVRIAREIIAATKIMHRCAELECSSEAAHRDLVACPASTRTRGPCLCAAYRPEGSEEHVKVPRFERTAARAQRRIETAIEPYNITANFGGDPRGAICTLKVPSGFVNNWGRDGVYVPVR